MPCERGGQFDGLLGRELTLRHGACARSGNPDRPASSCDTNDGTPTWNRTHGLARRQERVCEPRRSLAKPYLIRAKVGRSSWRRHWARQSRRQSARFGEVRLMEQMLARSPGPLQLCCPSFHDAHTIEATKGVRGVSVLKFQRQAGGLCDSLSGRWRQRAQAALHCRFARGRTDRLQPFALLLNFGVNLCLMIVIKRQGRVNLGHR